MRKRWSVGAVVAIAIGIAAVMAHESSHAMPALPVGQPVQVTLAIESDAVSLRINQDAPVFSFSL